MSSTITFDAVTKSYPAGKGAGSGSPAVDSFTARIEAGTVPVQGPGMLMTITPKDPQARPVGDQELLMVVNELNAAGAEAIAINGSRIVASSEIRLAGSHVNINGRPTAAPYVIEAIGPTQTLIAALQLYGGMVDQLTPTMR